MSSTEPLESPPQEEQDDQAAAADVEAEQVAESDLEDTPDDDEGQE